MVSFHWDIPNRQRYAAELMADSVVHPGWSCVVGKVEGIRKRARRERLGK